MRTLSVSVGTSKGEILAKINTLKRVNRQL